jgi:hypothetical protein
MWSQMTWKELTSGLIPPPQVSYDEWLKCQPAVIDVLADSSICNDENMKYSVMWSPRRHHAAVYFNNYIWVLGGRARELSEIEEIRTVGGITTPRVHDIYRDWPGVGVNFKQKFTNAREMSVVKSDVWKSVDGVNWILVTPGCRAPQSNFVAAGNEAGGKAGLRSMSCQSSSDCYGAEKCVQNTCVCQMWSSREQHAVAVYGSYMYVVGGFVSRLFSGISNCGDYACGDVDASSYRYYAQDVWRSKDGEVWTHLTLGTVDSYPGRGGHQMVILTGLQQNDKDRMIIFGGCGGNPSTNEVFLYNDMWEADPNNPTTWKRVASPVPWAPRTGHTVTVEPPSAGNGNQRILYLMGGLTPDGISQEVWAWRPDTAGDEWKLDYTKEALYRSASSLNNQLFNDDSPAIHYVTADSKLEEMIKFWIPTPDNVELSDPGMRPEIRQYVSDAQLEMLHSVGLYTIRDLAEANKYVILKLRGWDFPQVTKRLDFYDICDYRALAIAIVQKCK